MKRRKYIFILICVQLVMLSCTVTFFPENSNAIIKFGNSSENKKTPISTPLISTRQTEIEITKTSTVTEQPMTPPLSDDVIQEYPFTNIWLINNDSGWAAGWDTQSDEQQLWHTEDGGESWLIIKPDNLEFYSIGQSAFLDANNAWIPACKIDDDLCGLAKTIDGGRTWNFYGSSTVESFDSFYFFNQIFGYRINTSAGAGQVAFMIKESLDGGISWNPVAIKYDLNGNDRGGTDYLLICGICSDLFYIDQNRIFVVRGNLAQPPGNIIEYSLLLNRDENWQTNELNLPDGVFSPAYFSPKSPYFRNHLEGILPVIVMDDNFNQAVMVFYETHDGGLQWSYLSTIDNITDWNSMNNELIPISDDDYAIRCGWDLCVTHDAVRTWNRYQIDFAGYPGLDASMVRHIEFGDPDNGIMIIEYEEGKKTLMKTINGGIDWQIAKPTLIYTPNSD